MPRHGARATDSRTAVDKHHALERLNCLDELVRLDGRRRLTITYREADEFDAEPEEELSVFAHVVLSSKVDDCANVARGQCAVGLPCRSAAAPHAAIDCVKVIDTRNDRNRVVRSRAPSHRTGGEDRDVAADHEPSESPPVSAPSHAEPYETTCPLFEVVFII